MVQPVRKRCPPQCRQLAITVPMCLVFVSITGELRHLEAFGSVKCNVIRIGILTGLDVDTCAWFDWVRTP